MPATAFFNRRHALALLATVSPLWGATPVAAQPEGEFERTFGDIETVSIATGRSQSLQTAPAVASVITAEQIRDTGARDLIDILRLVPGFYLGRTANPFDPVVAVRGFSSSYNQTVLFMLDGVPQTELVLGDRRTTLGKIPLDLIDRVEVIRGPGSALYGADAYSAVVNIITRREVPEQSQLVLGGGTHATRDVRALGGGRWGDVKVVGALEYDETDGYAPFVAADQQTRLDALFGTHASLAPGTAALGRQEFGAQINFTGPKTSLGYGSRIGAIWGWAPASPARSIRSAASTAPFGKGPSNTGNRRATGPSTASWTACGSITGWTIGTFFHPARSGCFRTA